MKRFHAHVSVTNLPESIAFYSTLFAAAPTVSKPDYAKWELDDPRLNFAISSKADNAPGLNHLGIQVDRAEELDTLHHALDAAHISTHDETRAHCCYAESDKHWAIDPSGIAWETFQTLNTIPTYGTDRAQGLVPNTVTAHSSPGTIATEKCCNKQACCA